MQRPRSRVLARFALALSLLVLLLGLAHVVRRGSTGPDLAVTAPSLPVPALGDELDGWSADPARSDVAAPTAVVVASEDVELHVVDALTKAAIPYPEVQQFVQDGSDREPFTEPRFVGDERGVVKLARADIGVSGLAARARGYFVGSMRPEDVREQLASSRFVQIELSRSGSLRVRVTETDTDAPIRLARVSVQPGDADRRARAKHVPFVWPQFACSRMAYLPGEPPDHRVHSCTGEDGLYVVENLPTGVPLFVTADEAVSETSDLVTIPAESGFAELHLRGATGCRVEGRLAWSDGSPATNRQLRALEHGNASPPAEYAWTQLHGEFVFLSLALGRHSLLVGGIAAPALEFECRGPTLDLGVVTLPEVTRISGDVRCAVERSSAPYAALDVRVTRDGRAILETKTAIDGGFQGMVPPGPCRIGFGWGESVLHELDVDVPCAPIDVSWCDWVGSLRVRGAHAGPEPDFELRLIDWRDDFRQRPASATRAMRSGPGQFVQSDGADWVVFPIVPGDYRCVVRDRRDAPWRELGRVSITAGGETVVDGTGAACSGTISGRIVDARGDPVAGLEVAAVLEAVENPDDSGLRRTSTSDADGRFELDEFDCGGWIVFPRTLGARADGAVQANVSSGSRTAIELVSGAPASLEVTIVRAGRPASGARVQVKPAGEAYAQADLLAVSAGDDGIAHVTGLAPGEYVVFGLLLESGSRFNQGRYVALIDGEARKLSFDVACEPHALVFRAGDEPLRDLTAANFFARGGIRRGKVEQRTGVVEACLDPERWLVLLTRTSDQVSYTATRPDGAWFALLDAPAVASPEPLRVELGDASILVALRSDVVDARLPSARLLGAGGIAAALAPGVVLPLASEPLSATEILFPHLPTSARVRLVGRARSGSPAPSLEIELAENEQRVIDWPPRP